MELVKAPNLNEMYISWLYLFLQLNRLEKIFLRCETL